MVVDRPSWAPDEVDLSRPNAARLYDFFLGGSHNFPVDRDAARQVLRGAPEVAEAARANRAFLGRAVRMLAEAGVDQFLDLGSGIPTVGNVHEIAQRTNPQARVVYVDVDPVAVAHTRSIMAANDLVGVVKADLRQLDAILADPITRRLLDFGRPLAVLLVSVLHFIADEDDPIGVLAGMHNVLAPGSYLVLSHGTADYAPERETDADAVKQLYSRTATPVHLRTPEQVKGLFAGFKLVDPGVVPLPQWRPDDNTRRIANFLAGVALRAEDQPVASGHSIDG